MRAVARSRNSSDNRFSLGKDGEITIRSFRSLNVIGQLRVHTSENEEN